MMVDKDDIGLQSHDWGEIYVENFPYDDAVWITSCEECGMQIVGSIWDKTNYLYVREGDGSCE